MQTSYVGAQPVSFGDIKVCVLQGVAGPTSYAQSTGDPVYNPAAGDFIVAPIPSVTLSKNYFVEFFPLSAGDIRAGSPSASVSGWTAIWLYSGNLGVETIAQNAAGSGMTVGDVGTVTFTGGGGTGATGTFTVLTATTGVFALTNGGAGYTSTPTATVTGTGGTPPTVTVTVFPGYGPVANATNLSAETLQFGALVSER
jgi:hypothetical protein